LSAQQAQTKTIGLRPRVGPLLERLLTGLICLEPMAMAYYMGVEKETLNEDPVGWGSPLDLRHHATSARR
jgi:hypothetical protein